MNRKFYDECSKCEFVPEMYKNYIVDRGEEFNCEICIWYRFWKDPLLKEEEYEKDMERELDEIEKPEYRDKHISIKKTEKEKE